MQTSVLKGQLKELCVGTLNGVEASDSTKVQIEEVAKELNKLNPTKDPAYSTLIAGKWRLLHSTVPGPSSGRLGPFVGRVFQDIRPEEKRIVNILELGPSFGLRVRCTHWTCTYTPCRLSAGKNYFYLGALEADVEILDGNNWAISFDLVYNRLAGIKVQEQKFPRDMERRIWHMTFMDSDFRVLYGRQESMPEKDGYIFVLEKVAGSESESA